MKETLPKNDMENLQKKKVVEAPKELDQAQMASEMLANITEQSRLQEVIANDKADSSQQYEEIKSGIAGIESHEEIKNKQEQIKNKIKALEKEIAQRIEDYRTLTTISRSDTGLGNNLGSFGGPGEVETFTKKYPDLQRVANLMRAMKKKSSSGLKFWKKPELSEGESQIIRNKLITGIFGRVGENSNDPEKQARDQARLDKYSQEVFDKFVKESEITPEGEQATGNESAVMSAREIIGGPIANLKKEAEALKAELAK